MMVVLHTPCWKKQGGPSGVDIGPMDLEQIVGLLRAMRQVQETGPRHPGLEQRMDSGLAVLDSFLLETFLLHQFEQRMRHAIAEDPDELDQLIPLPMALLIPTLLQRPPTPSRQRPLDEQTLQSLPKIVVTPATLRRLQNTGSGDASCVICQEEFALGQRLVQLPCDHTFCADCGCQWLRRSNACPVCRREVEPLDPHARPSDTAWNSDDLFAFRHLPQGSPLAAVRRARDTREENQEVELWPPLEDMASLAEQHSGWQEGSRPASGNRGGRLVTPTPSTLPGSAVAEQTAAAGRLSHSSSSAPMRPHSRASRAPLRLPPVTQAVDFSQPSRERENVELSRRSRSRNGAS